MFMGQSDCLAQPIRKIWARVPTVWPGQPVRYGSELPWFCPANQKDMGLSSYGFARPTRKIWVWAPIVWPSQSESYRKGQFPWYGQAKLKYVSNFPRFARPNKKIYGSTWAKASADTHTYILVAHIQKYDPRGCRLKPLEEEKNMRQEKRNSCKCSRKSTK